MNKQYPIAFVFIVEQGDLEVKSILLAENLHKFFPDASKYTIYAIRLRVGNEISKANKKVQFSISYLYTILLQNDL